MRVFMYAHDITERDQANIVNIDRLLLFRLKRKGATKQMIIHDFLRKLDLTVEIISVVYVF
jgi:hypothetical protein